MFPVTQFPFGLLPSGWASQRGWLLLPEQQRLRMEGCQPSSLILGQQVTAIPGRRQFPGRTWDNEGRATTDTLRVWGGNLRSRGVT